jgi:hypothetical protein
MTITSACAVQSGRPDFGPRDSGTSTEVSTMAHSPTGTLTQKMPRQPTVPTSTPPTTGPSAMPMPNMPTQMAIARARCVRLE